MAGTALAQPVQPQVVTITGNSRGNTASVAGFGEVPLASAPFSATVINALQLQDAGIKGLGDITRLDAGITDAYNPPGYWSQLAVRGFTLDNRFNYRRDGLPINAETFVGQANKQALEVLKGTSGLQAGTSAPGGLVNLVVKRPQRALRSATLSAEQPGTLGAALDVGDRIGTDGRIGWRLNASAERLDPSVRNTRGQRSLLAGALDLQAGPGSLLEAEVELGRQRQPSVPGFSVLGGRLPDAKGIDPRINLNNQAWSQPVEFESRTASLRYTVALSNSVDLAVHGMTQRLRTDDRVAFPYGCSAEDAYDRYCSDGSFDLYDFRSEGERRRSSALAAQLTGRLHWAGFTHRFNAGVLATRFDSGFGAQAYNFAGTGRIDGTARVPANAAPGDQNTDRKERSTEVHLQDMVALTDSTRLWAGLRHTRLQRASVRTDGSRPTDYGQSITTPWLALSTAVAAQTTAYASWGTGVESDVAPNRARYANAGQALPALKSRQIELGIKRSDRSVDWQVAAFDIRRPESRDVGSCDSDRSCLRRVDGQSRHTGLEADAQWNASAFSLRGSAMALRARIEGSDDPALQGKRPTNVPASSLKLQTAYNVGSLPGLAVLAFLTREGRRMVLPDNSIVTPGWTRVDLAARFTQRLPGAGDAVWRVGIDNVADQRAWKEAPYQYGHAYLYPLAPRTLHASVTTSF